MARPRRTDAGLVAKAQAALREAKTPEQLRCAQAVLLPAVMGSTLEQTAAVLGVSRATVARLQNRFRTSQLSGGGRPRPWGGRRRSLMNSLERERSFLAPWMEQAKRGEMLVVAALRPGTQSAGTRLG